MAEEKNQESPVKLFNKGMNQDIDPKILENGYYIEGHNIEIISDNTGTSFDVTNTKGNSYKITFPVIRQVQEIKINTLPIEPVTCNITIGGNIGTISLTSTSTLLDIYNCIATITGYNSTFFAYISGTHIVIYSPIGGSYIGDITISYSAGSDYLNLNTEYIPEQPIKDFPYNIIGSVPLRDSIYLYTTCCTDKNPGGHSGEFTPDASSVGQIWKMSYDKVALTVTLTLTYNNYVDFSTYWGISPTSTIGRYENDAIQRIYWTDNFNRIRQCNVVAENLLALDITQLDIVPGVDFDIPIMTNRNGGGGSKPIGAYQCAYRYKNTGGAVTGWSNLSNIIYLTQYDDKNGIDNFLKNVGADSGTTTDQTITWTFSNLDKDFNTIEIAVCRRVSSTASPDIFIITELPIIQDNITYTYTGNETPINVTLEEFLNTSAVFTHCKTLGSKDNRLFVANVRTEQQELNYDARAYRWNSGGIFKVVNDGVLSPGLTSADYDDPTYLAETKDTINPSLYIPSPVTGFIYQSDGSTLGGEGPHISYEFFTMASECDSSSTNYKVIDDELSPWRWTNPNLTTNDVTLDVKSITNLNTEYNQVYTNNFALGKVNAGIKYNSVATLVRGYQRNEIYRFGIQFYDKSKNPYYVKWIGDIKFPDYWEFNPNPLYEDGTFDPLSNFNLVFAKNTGYQQAFVRHLGIKFTVNIPDELIPLIDGYSIVRVKREQKDKTILATGVINPVMSDSDIPNQLYCTSLYNNTFSPFNDAGNFTYTMTDFENRLFFTCPNPCDQSQPTTFTGKTLKIKGILEPANSDNQMYFTGGGFPSVINDYFKYYKMNDPGGLASGTLIDNSIFLSPAGTAIDEEPGAIYRPINNFDIGARWDTGLGMFVQDTTRSFSVGNPITYIRLNSAIDWDGTIGNTNFNKYFVTIEHSLVDQYGGNTFVARSNNQYMSCQHYRPVRSNSINDTFLLFGGDTWVQIYDSLRWSCNFGNIRTPVDWTSGHDLFPFSGAQFFPTETDINTELRYGGYINRFYKDEGSLPGEYYETYTTNAVFSLENDIQVYFPKPYPFINNNIFDNRFYASEIKINGELTDNWGIFKSENYWDVEGIYGPVNAMRILKDKMYFWQNRAFGVMEINPRVVLQDQNNTALQLGTGQVLQRHDYISTEVGLQHQWGLTWNSYQLFWLDVALKKFFAYTEGQAVSPDSDIKGLYSWFQHNLNYNINKFDRPVYYDTITKGINGIRMVYDYKKDQVIICITDTLDKYTTPNYYTLICNTKTNSFTSFRNAQSATLFPTDGYYIFSPYYNGEDMTIYMEGVGNYGEWYGIKYPSKIKFSVNTSPTITKTFDNLFLDVQSLNSSKVNQYSDFWNKIRVYNDSQNTDYQNFVIKTSYNSPINWNVNRKERTWKLAIPRNRVINVLTQSPDIFNPTNLSSPNNKSFGDRMRDKYFIVDLVYNNQDNNLLITNNVIPNLRESNR
jgi:hypothetical protein